MMRNRRLIILRISLWAFIAFGIHFTSFLFVSPVREASVLLSRAVLRTMENVMVETYLTDYDPKGDRDSLQTSRADKKEHPGSLRAMHASEPGIKLVLIFWSLVYLLVASIAYFTVRIIRIGPTQQSSNRTTMQSTAGRSDP